MRCHPPEETLLGFSSGHADLAQRVLAEAHLAMCSACRQTVAEMAAPGGRLLASLPAQSPSAGLWERISSELSSSAVTGAGASHLDELPLPPAARTELPALGRLRWRSAWKGTSQFALVHANPHDRGFLVAARAPRQSGFPAHEHLGPEDGVILAGGYDDEFGSFEVGDYAVYEAGSRHQPETDRAEGCVILVRLELPNRFLGWRGWAQRLFS
jgi:putative transcriptional regulator